eukprot:c16692_g1_i2 orf=80-1228(+)
MATTGALVGSSTLLSMKQLHALHSLGCRSPTMLLPDSCKAGSLVFFLFLPTRLNSITSTRQRLPLSPPMCGHGDLEIVSVKELADGSLHFSFGPPPNVIVSSKVDELSSSNGEHFAGKLSTPRRLPSKFSKKLPIPVAAVRRRKRQGENSTKQGLAEATPPSVKETLKFSSRPKSCFVKRSPIPVGTNVQSLLNETQSDKATAQDKSQLMPQRTKIVSLKAGPSKRPPSTFVRKSPVPQTVRHHIKPLLPSANADALSDDAGDSAVGIQGKSTVAEASRPKSIFSRRSPIVKVHERPSQVTTRKSSHKIPPSYKDSSNVDDDLVREASGKSPTISKNSPLDIVDLDKCKLAELKNVAKVKGLKGYSKLKKGELLNLLKNLDS